MMLLIIINNGDKCYHIISVILICSPCQSHHKVINALMSILLQAAQFDEFGSKLVT